MDTFMPRMKLRLQWKITSFPHNTQNAHIRQMVRSFFCRTNPQSLRRHCYRQIRLNESETYVEKLKREKRFYSQHFSRKINHRVESHQTLAHNIGRVVTRGWKGRCHTVMVRVAATRDKKTPFFNFTPLWHSGTHSH